MKTRIFLICLLLTAILPCAIRAQRAAKLQSFYQAKQFFDLRDELLRTRNVKSVEVLFYRGAVANKFNRIQTSIVLLRDYLKRVKNDSRQVEALELLADDYVKIYQYAKAADTYRILIAKYSDQLSADRLRDAENSYRLFDAARRVPPQTISFGQSTKIQGTRDQAGLLNIPVEINSQKNNFVFDTGANISVVTETIARKLDLQIIETEISVGTSTDAKVESKLGVAKRMKIGNAVLQNVLFLVMPDESLYISPIKYQINGIVGFPVIEAFGTVSISNKDELSISAINEISNRGEPNLCLDELLPLVAVNVENQRLTFSLDSGAATTTLNPSFDKLFTGKTKNLVPQTIKIGGAGGIKEVSAYRLPTLNLIIAGKTAKLSDVELLTEQINDQSRYYAGNIGQDLIKQFNKFTLDFRWMRIKFD